MAIARHSTVRRLTMIDSDAATMPMVWMHSENDRATGVSMSSTLVNTGNATAPPPWGVEPATKLPNTIVSAEAHLSPTRPQCPRAVTKTSQTISTPNEMASARRVRVRVVLSRCDRPASTTAEKSGAVASSQETTSPEAPPQVHDAHRAVGRQPDEDPGGGEHDDVGGAGHVADVPRQPASSTK